MRSQIKGMSRRQFMSRAASGALILTTGRGARVWASGLKGYQGRLLVTLQLSGGCDVTQFCDPKVNTPGEPKINNWADLRDPENAGRISYAPVADNQRLFQTFGADMLVVNGVDCQTNSHETGMLFNWTGSNAEGMPSMTALHAAAQAPDQPLAYSVFGGTARTASLINLNRFNSLSALRPLADPTTTDWGDSARPPNEIETAQRMAAASIADILSSPNATPRQVAAAANQQIAREGRDRLTQLADILPAQEDIPEGIQMRVGDYDFWSNLEEQILGALTVFKSGLGASADLEFGGFDTHDGHDEPHEWLFTQVSNGIHYFWEQAERMGLADRITLIVGSDFSRTNFYNDGDGKDHWPIGSYIIMEQNARWGNRVVGQTNELHFAKTINPQTLKVATGSSAITMTPAHVNKAVRNYMGIEDYAVSVGYGMQDVTSLPLFNRNKFTS